MNEVLRRAHACATRVGRGGGPLFAATARRCSPVGGNLEDVGFFRLADLLEWEPRWHAEGSYRDRAGAVGPDEAKVRLRYEIGTVRIATFRRWAERNGKNDDEVAAAIAFLDALPKPLPAFSFKLDYSRPGLFDRHPGATAPFEADAVKTCRRRCAGGFIAHARQQRWLVEATYEDPQRRSSPAGSLRRHAELDRKRRPDLAQLTGGSDLVVSFVYANSRSFVARWTTTSACGPG